MESLTIIKLFVLMIAAYVCGSIPWGVILTRLFTNKDIRRYGSGNIGATNVRRIAGNTLGILTLAGDVSKGAAPVLLAKSFFSAADPWATMCIALVAFCAVLGHLAPIFFMFKSGGKGVATAFGTSLAISPVATGGALLVFIWVLWRYRYVSLGSLAAVATLPAFIWVSTRSFYFMVLAVIIAILIYTRHADNIRRLRDGTEPATGPRKK
jgi:acyl phosphate:glycerol-3-phosphate acyltransferase